MTVVRCKRCRIVVLDSNDDGDRKVQCPECGAKYKISLVEGDIVYFERLDEIAGTKES